MESHELKSGLIVERNAFPRDVIPNPNPAIGTVGPNVPAGYGDTHVMYDRDNPPLQAQAWDGWPVEWAVPSNLTGAGVIANRISIVFSAIDLNARIVGSLPLYTKKENVVLGDMPSWIENPAPGLYYGWTDAVEQMIWTYQRRGEIFLWALSRYADGTVKNFAVLNPDQVDVQRGEDGYPEYRLLVDGDEWGTDYGVLNLRREDVLFIPYARWPGELRGHSPLEAVAGNLESAFAAAYHAENLARRGGIPWGVLNAPYELSDNEVDRLRAQWTDSAAKRDGAPAITSGGFSLEALSVSPKEMALLEQREFDEARIAIALGVQPYQMGLAQGGGGLVYQNVTQIFSYHWRSFLRPVTRKISEAISFWALPHKTRMRFNPEQYIRGDLDSRVGTYEKLIEMGVLDAGMVRDMEEFTSPGESPADGTTEGRTQFG